MPYPTKSLNFHEVSDGQIPRHLAFNEYGDPQANHIFLCLPGILETSDSFFLFCNLLLSKLSARIISPDYCGRGHSTPLKVVSGYKMSTYLDDLIDLLNRYVFKTHQSTQFSFYIVGNSMGGILAMHLLNQSNHSVKALILNDIGLTLKWHSIFSLYGKLKEQTQSIGLALLAKQLGVHKHVIEAVNSPSHFDLEYEYDFSGMYFNALLEKFDGSVVLIHSEKSKICPSSIAKNSKLLYPELITFSTPGQVHPVAWTETILEWLIHTLQISSDPTISIRQPIQQSVNLTKDSKPKELPFLEALHPNLSIVDHSAIDLSTIKLLTFEVKSAAQNQNETLTSELPRSVNSQKFNSMLVSTDSIIHSFLITSKSYLMNHQEKHQTLSHRICSNMKKIKGLAKRALGYRQDH